MSFIKMITFIGASFFLMLFSLAHASGNAQTEPVAVITFSNVENTKSIVYTAYKTILGMDKPLRKLFQLAIDAILAANSSSDVDYLNTKFQAKKYEITHQIHHSKLMLTLFQKNEITIEIRDDGNGNHLTFYLPELNIIHLTKTSINTIDGANAAIAELTALLNKIDEILPSNTTNDELKKFANPRESLRINTADLNHLTMTHIEDCKVILSSLIDLKANIKTNLNQLLSYAQTAANGKHTEEEMSILDTEYNQQCWSFRMNFYINASHTFDTIKLYNDITLNFQMNGKNRNYFFPKIDLALLRLDDDNILDLTAAITSINHLSSTYQWMMDWTITGKTSLTDSAHVNPLMVLPLLDLNAQEMTALQKNLVNQHQLF